MLLCCGCGSAQPWVSLGVFGQVSKLGDNETSWKMHDFCLHGGGRATKVCHILLLIREILGRSSEEEDVGTPWGHAVLAHWIYCTRSTHYSQLTTEALACSFILQSFYFFFPKCIKSTKQLSFYDSVISVVIQALDDQMLRGGGA